MSTTKAAALFVALSAGTCTDDPEAPQLDYRCAHAFDDGCRYTADVSITGGRLTSAYIEPTADGVASHGSYEGLAGSVTLTDSLGVAPPVTCDFAADLVIDTTTSGGTASVSVDSTPVISDGCPLTCAWFLPAAGTFDAETGRYRVSMFEGHWELELGASAPDEPEYGPLWITSDLSSVSFGTGATLDAPVDLLAGGWSAPLEAPPGSATVSSCP